MTGSLIRKKLNTITDRSSMINSVEYFDIIDSTNSYALKKIKTSDTADGILIYANEQSNGRGRRDKIWDSPTKGLYFSLIIDGMYPPLFSLIVGLSVSKAIEDECGYKTHIKWPNDVYIENKKVSGILIETSCEKSIVGVGINTVKENIIKVDTAISIGEFTDERKVDLIVRFLNHLEIYLHKFSTLGFATIRDEITDKLLYLDELVAIEMGTTSYQGLLKGIGDSGEVLLWVNNQLKAFHSGSLIKINNND
jgi:BirA family biotin operon repressor/biotin-[acetyl-CoA-carboxylase] ligase